MKFTIVHETKYLFSDDVFLEPHYLRFRPKNLPFVDVKQFSIDIENPPEGRSVNEDAEHNIIDFCWFNNVTNSLTIKAHSHLETKPYNPFDFIIHPDSFNTLPFIYSEHQHQILYACLQQPSLNGQLVDYAQEVLSASSHNTIAFLIELTKKIHHDFSVEYRHDGAPLTPQNTFSIKKGSCRDLSWMQINMFRHFGIAARFVSGYFYFEMDKPVYELHAWVEVFLPGTGWLGVDPSHGILTGNTHFALASSAIPENTMPVSGGIRGNASSQLFTALKIIKDES